MNILIAATGTTASGGLFNSLILIIFWILIIGFPIYLIIKDIKKERTKKENQIKLLKEQNKLLEEQNKLLKNQED